MYFIAADGIEDHFINKSEIIFGCKSVVMSKYESK